MVSKRQHCAAAVKKSTNLEELGNVLWQQSVKGSAKTILDLCLRVSDLLWRRVGSAVGGQRTVHHNHEESYRGKLWKLVSTCLIECTVYPRKEKKR